MGKNWYVSKENLETFLEGDKVINMVTNRKKRHRMQN